MPGHRHCCLIVLVSLLEGVLMGTGNVSKSGCYGDSVALYSNISINDNFTVVSVYKNGDHNNRIGWWSRKNSISSSGFVHEYMNKLTLDNNGNIWIHWLHISDEAEYNINIDKGNGSSDNVVQLVLLVPPTTNCKPKIERINDVLTVFLETMDCGRPAASVYWLNNSGIFHNDTKAIELQPRNRAGIYYACVEGDALRCAKSSRLSEYCSAFTVDEETWSKEQIFLWLDNNTEILTQYISTKLGRNNDRGGANILHCQEHPELRTLD